MSLHLSRRGLLAGAAGLAACGLAPLPLFRPAPARAAAPLPLTLSTRTLEVKGRAATVYGLTGPDGRPGLTLAPDQRFAVALSNTLTEPAIIHWHGQTPPWAQDGVAGAAAGPLTPGETRTYDFAPKPGTHWMHSHLGLQEQKLMAAPLIVHTAADRADDRQEVVVLLHDFTFREPEAVLRALQGGAMSHAMPGMDHSAMGHSGMSDMSGMSGMGHAMPMDHAAMGHGAMPEPDHANELDYDAYLANDRTLDDPEVVAVERRGRVLLRLINGATATAFHVLLAPAMATLLAVDGEPVAPVQGDRFPLAMGQRLDLLLDLPAGGGALPVIFQREQGQERTGIILAPPGASVGKLSDRAAAAAPLLDLALERRLRPLRESRSPVPQRQVTVALAGSMMPYAWSMTAAGAPAGQLPVTPGERLRVALRNTSSMPHPIHLHGHAFQVVGIDGTEMAGAWRDTVLVPARGQVDIAFTADNPGHWPFHCHNLLHMASGMMLDVIYPAA